MCWRSPAKWRLSFMEGRQERAEPLDRAHDLSSLSGEVEAVARGDRSMQQCPRQRQARSIWVAGSPGGVRLVSTASRARMGAPAMKTVVAVKALPMPWARIAWAWGDTRASGCAAALRVGEQRGDQLLHVLPGRGVLG